MTGLDWIPLYEKFGSFASHSRRLGLFSRELEIIEKSLEDICPLPKVKENSDIEASEENVSQAKI